MSSKASKPPFSLELIQKKPRAIFIKFESVFYIEIDKEILKII